MHSQWDLNSLREPPPLLVGGGTEEVPFESDLIGHFYSSRNENVLGFLSIINM